MKFIGITFTGVDEWTEPVDLAVLQKKYPYVEFGILMSKNYRVNGNRYPNPEIFTKISAYGNVKWSGHLCGSMARDAYAGNWYLFNEYFKTFTKNPEVFYDVLNRIQLNVSEGLESYINKFNFESCPIQDVEIIIQQNSVHNCYLYNLNKSSKIRLLVDPSGGKGESANWTTDNLYNENPNEIVGYAGGINKHNVIDVLNFLETNSNCYYWIDLETGARDKNDRFDVYKISKILKSVDKWRNRMISKEMNHGR